MPRKKNRRDKNEPAIIEEVITRRNNWSIHQMQGSGLPDLLVGAELDKPIYVGDSAINGINFVAEVKTPKTGRLTEAQKQFIMGWRGQYNIVLDADSIIKIGDTLKRQLKTEIRFTKGDWIFHLEHIGEAIKCDYYKAGSYAGTQLVDAYSNEAHMIYRDGVWMADALSKFGAYLLNLDNVDDMLKALQDG